MRISDWSSDVCSSDLLHHFSRVLLSEQELHDGLVLLASALVVLPLLPSAAVDPWGVLRPDAVWRLVVLVMGVGVLGHIAQRAAGTRWGLPLAGSFARFEIGRAWCRARVRMFV